VVDGDPDGGSEVLVWEDVVVDQGRKAVHFSGSGADLTKTEYLLLATLIRRPTKVFDRDELMSGVYGPSVYVAERTINSHMRRLRAKLGEIGGYDPVITIRGFGYRMRRRGEVADEEE
jgi:two-component system OmpR family response regulator